MMNLIMDVYNIFFVFALNLSGSINDDIDIIYDPLSAVFHQTIKTDSIALDIFRLQYIEYQNICLQR